MTNRILLVANWDWVLYNFRLPLARALEEAGLDVLLVCPSGEYFERIKDEGFQLVAWNLERRSTSPFKEWLAMRHLLRLYRELNPAAVHHFTIKPIVYGSVAARLADIPRVFNNFTGLGFLFTNTLKARLLRALVAPVVRLADRGDSFVTLFQNEHDRDQLISHHVVQAERVFVIPGTGVDLKKFTAQRGRQARQAPVVLMASRLLLDKGVREFVEAASQLRQAGVAATFQLAGQIDEGNPAHVPPRMLEQWMVQGVVEFLGHRADMPELLRQADIAVLPSYHEGVPLFLLEAAASGLPIVATDIAGCRIVVEDGENGLLVPVKDAAALAAALKSLIENPKLRARMGDNSRIVAASKFGIDSILEQYLEVFRQFGVLEASSTEAGA